MLTELPRDLALAVLDLMPLDDRLKLAVLGHAWRDLAMAPSSAIAMSFPGDEVSRVDAMTIWLMDMAAGSTLVSRVRKVCLASGTLREFRELDHRGRSTFIYGTISGASLIICSKFKHSVECA